MKGETIIKQQCVKLIFGMTPLLSPTRPSSIRCESSRLLPGYLVQPGYLEGDQMYGACTYSSFSTHTLRCRLGCQAVMDSSVLPPFICVRLCYQCASSFTLLQNKVIQHLIIPFLLLNSLCDRYFTIRSEYIHGD